MKYTEADLAAHFINTSIPDHDIYQEVPCGGIIDIVTLKGSIITAYEVKKCFSFDVIEQAVKNKHFAHYSYVVIPYTKSTSFAYRIARDYGIGVITIGTYNDRFKTPIEVVAPRLNRVISKPKLRDWQKTNLAGVQSGRLTAFGNTVNELTKYLERQPGGRRLTSQALLAVNHHYGSFSSAKSSLMNMVRKGVIKEFRFDNDHIILNTVIEGKLT